ncbi:MAG TPA: type II secretion system protein [Tepidisphaeraceae bacterium]|nr:type II secretion system protein [Tepidisphaeraceae bacterium]
MHRRARPGLQAFSLVELLVVIGIIAVLVGILLPTLSRTRELARRTQCLSNIRELSNALRIYAARYRDAIPIGYMDQNNFNYFVNWNNNNGTKVSMLGLLALDRLTPNPKAFYCPSMDDPMFSFDTPQNPWPPFDKWPDHPRFKTKGLGHTRISYMTRPIANWPAGNFDEGYSEQYVTAGNSHIANWIPYLGTNWTANSTHLSKLVFAMPRLSKLKNKAMLSDLLTSSEFVRRTHKTGVNVLYANGSAQWVDLTRWVARPIPAAPAWTEQDVWRRWRSIQEDGAFGSPTPYNDYFLCEEEYFGGSTTGTIPRDKLPLGVWVNLDRLAGSSVK